VSDLASGPKQSQAPVKARLSFDVFPAIDLLDGQSVRLRKGKRDTAHQVHPDPLVQVEGYLAAGAKWVHIVNLNAAFGASHASGGRRRALRCICSVTLRPWS
jgi:phosphoribosylformimino-5-aminoimidazole carboxamide ribonucleotide (ProFAR) isomerase